MKDKRIIYWREYPIDVEIGMYEELSKKIDNEIIFLCNNDFPKERKSVEFDYPNIRNSQTIIIDDDSKLIDKYINDIHIFFGITGKNGVHLRKLLKKDKNVKFFIVGERPNVYGNFIKRLWCRVTRFGYYRLFSFLYNKRLLGFFTMGEKAIEIYKLLGFKEKKLFNYMYTLKMHDIDNYVQTKEKIKFLYIGRFDDETKGLDIIRDCFDKIELNNYQLDLVGGYGKDAKVTIEWAKEKPNVNYIGKWSNKDVIKKMHDYDICLVPSKYDGWNLAPNQVIDAGISIIISNNATSDELIKKANNGVIFNYKRKKEFLNALNVVLNNPKKVDEFKKNSLAFKKYISNELISDYFINVIKYCVNNYEGERPVVPWINR